MQQIQRRQFNKLACLIPFFGFDLKGLKKTYDKYVEQDKRIADNFGKYKGFSYKIDIDDYSFIGQTSKPFRYVVFPTMVTLYIKYEYGQIEYITFNPGLSKLDSKEINIKKNVSNAITNYMNKITQLDIQKLIIAAVTDEDSDIFGVEINNSKWKLASISVWKAEK